MAGNKPVSKKQIDNPRNETFRRHAARRAKLQAEKSAPAEVIVDEAQKTTSGKRGASGK